MFTAVSESDSEEIAITRGHKPASKVEEPKPIVTPSQAKKAREQSVKKKPSKPKIRSVEDIDHYAYDVINNMKDIYKSDSKCMEEGKPAMMKIENVDEIYHKLMKKETQEACVKLGALQEIRKWLEPLRDNSLPNPKIKKVFLELLFNIRVNKADLLNSGVGKIIHFYSKNRHESKDVKKMAFNVMKKWKSMIIKEEIEE